MADFPTARDIAIQVAQPIAQAVARYTNVRGFQLEHTSDSSTFIIAHPVGFPDGGVSLRLITLIERFEILAITEHYACSESDNLSILVSVPMVPLPSRWEGLRAALLEIERSIPKCGICGEPTICGDHDGCVARQEQESERILRESCPDPECCPDWDAWDQNHNPNWAAGVEEEEVDL